MTPLLCRASRAILGWTQTELAGNSGTTRHIVRNYENAGRISHSDDLLKMESALTGADIRFIDEYNGCSAIKMKGLSWPARCRAARAMLGWTHLDVAKASGVSEMTVMRLESERLTFNRATLAVIRIAFEAAGVVFLDDGAESGVGVGLKRTK
jgi:transcriptional regulator with XRE-family HTH domain